MSDDERKARLAQALRQNLRRRKGQARGPVDDASPTRVDPMPVDPTCTEPVAD